MRIALVGTRGCRRGTAASRPAWRRSGPGWPRAGTTSSSTAARPASRRPSTYRGHAAGAPARPAPPVPLETLSHTALSVAHLMRPPDRRGLRVQRGQRPVPADAAGRAASRSRRTSTGWSGSGRSGAAPGAATTVAEQLAVRWSDALDRRRPGHRRLLPRRVRAATTPDRLRRAAHRPTPARRGWPSSASSPGGYHLVVARFEPENHVDSIVEGYVRSAAAPPLVVVGSAPVRRRVHRAGRSALADDRVRFLGGVWDQRRCSTSCTPTPPPTCTGTRWAGPTRRCCARSAPVRRSMAYDVELQPRGARRRRRSTSSTAGGRRPLVERAEADPAGAAVRGVRGPATGAEAYDWDDVADRYEQLAEDLAARRLPAPEAVRPSARPLGGMMETVTTSGRPAPRRAPEGYGDVVRRLSAAQKSGKGAPAYSRYVNRRLGRRFAAAAYLAGMRPNQVTVVSAVFSLRGDRGPRPGAGDLVVRAARGRRPRARLRLGRRRRPARPPARRRLGLRRVARPHGRLREDLGPAPGRGRRASTGSPTWPAAWLLVPIGYAVVGRDVLLRADPQRTAAARAGAEKPVGPDVGRRPRCVRSLAKIPLDYGVLCLVFVLLGWPVLFLVRLRRDVRRRLGLPAAGLGGLVPRACRSSTGRSPDDLGPLPPGPSCRPARRGARRLLRRRLRRPRPGRRRRARP